MLKFSAQLLSYLLTALIPYWMITAGDPAIFFLLFSIPIILLLYFSGPLLSAGVAAFASLVGTGAMIFNAGSFLSPLPFVYLIETGWLWLLFWITGKLIESADLETHRLQEDIEKLEVKTSSYEQEGSKLQELCETLKHQIYRYSQLRSFTEELGSSNQVKDIETKVDFFLKKFFGRNMDSRVALHYFESPNDPSDSDALGAWVVKNRIPLLVTDISEDARFSFLGPNRRGSLMVSPIERENRIVGTLAVESVKPEQWREQDLRFFSDLSNIVSLALSNAVYYEKVESLAVKDSLTHLFVRKRFDERIEEEFARARAVGSNLTLLMLDIDHFKKINDRHGHTVGDQVLKHVAEVVLNQTRETDFCARYGGEEIAVLMPLTSLENSYQIAERIREKVMTEKFGSSGASVTLSGGIASIQSYMRGPEQLIESADRALYKSKSGGRNRITMDL